MKRSASMKMNSLARYRPSGGRLPTPMPLRPLGNGLRPDSVAMTAPLARNIPPSAKAIDVRHPMVVFPPVDPAAISRSSRFASLLTPLAEAAGLCRRVRDDVLDRRQQLPYDCMMQSYPTIVDYSQAGTAAGAPTAGNTWRNAMAAKTFALEAAETIADTALAKGRELRLAPL